MVWQRFVGERYSVLATLLFVAMLASVTGCFTPEEYRARAASMPDPRQEMLQGMWDALIHVSKEEKWTIAIARKQDLILTTEWLPVEETLRKRVRCLIIKTPQAVGLNTKVTYQRLDQRDDSPTPQWVEITEPDLIKRSKLEERNIVKRIYDTWDRLQ